MKDIYIIDTLRSPKASTEEEGGLISLKPVDILVPLLKHSISTNSLSTDAVEEIIIGCASQVELQGSQLANAARALSGLSPLCKSVMVNGGRVSSFNSLEVASAKIASQQTSLCIVGAINAQTKQHAYMFNNMLQDDPALYRKLNYIPLQLAADCLATLKNFTRRDLDQYAFNSHKKANAAYLEGKLKKSLLTLRDSLNRPIASYDELIKENLTMEELADNRPFYERESYDLLNKTYKSILQLNSINHLHHADNSAKGADGASIFLLGSKEAATENGLIPQARIRSVSFATPSGNDLFSAQKNATLKALASARLEIEDIELFEIDESFSALALNFIDQFRLNPEKVNVNGGSIATGEAYGTEALFMISSLVDELQRSQKRLGLITLYGELDSAYCMIIELCGEAL